MIQNEEKRTQIMSYIVHAGEIIAQDDNIPKKSYKYLYVPSGPEFYTGVLKAAGYLFLDKNVSDITFVIQQSNKPSDIVFYGKKQLLILGQTIKNDKPKSCKIVSAIPTEIEDQLLYMKLITKAESVRIIGIGKDVKNKTVLDVLQEHSNPKSGVIFLGTCAYEEIEHAAKKTDMLMIGSMIENKQFKENPEWLGNKYIAYIKKQKAKPTLVAYINSADVGGSKTKTSGYACMVA